MAARGARAYIGCSGVGVGVVDVSEPAAPELISNWQSSASISDIRCLGDQLLVACAEEAILLDPSATPEPVIVSSLSLAGVLIREVAVSEPLAAIPLGAAGALLASWADPLAPVDLAKLPTAQHLLWVGASEQWAFLARGEGEFEVLDITDPASPLTLGTTSLGGNFTDLVMAGDKVLLGDEQLGLRIVDISDPLHIEELTDPIASYRVSEITCIGELAVLASTSVGLRVVDFTDPTDLQEVGGLSGSFSEVAVAADLALVLGNFAGLKIIDLSDPAQPFERGFLQITSAYDVAARGHHAFLVVSGSGAVVVDLMDPDNPAIVAELDIPYSHVDFCYLSGDFLHLVEQGYNRPSSLWAVDISDPAQPVLVGESEVSGRFWDLGTATERIFVPAYDTGLWILRNELIAAAGVSPVGVQAGLVNVCPNPFNPRTEISFNLAKAQRVRVEVFDLAGKMISQLSDRSYPAGLHRVRWDGSDAVGRQQASGVYLVRLEMETGVRAKKVMLLR